MVLQNGDTVWCHQIVLKNGDYKWCLVIVLQNCRLPKEPAGKSAYTAKMTARGKYTMRLLYCSPRIAPPVRLKSV